MAWRLQAMGLPGYEQGFQLQILPQRLEEPFKRKKPTTYFVNSMSDLFHDRIADEYIEQVFDTIRRTPQHTYQVLSKRTVRMARFFRSAAACCCRGLSASRLRTWPSWIRRTSDAW
jgi:protein gp37